MGRTLIAVDTGGTFTDAVTLDVEQRSIATSKVLTTYNDLTDGILESVTKAPADWSSATSLKHGTTQVINALLQRDGARTALITTRGFRDVLALRRGNRPVAFDLDYTPDEPLVPRDLCFEVSERMDARGNVVVALDEAELADIATAIQDLEVEAIAISFINSYANPDHERRAAEILSKLVPDASIATGSEASREWYEYERTATAAANAYVAPRVSSYVAALDRRLVEAGFTGTFFLMASHGGVMPAQQAITQPTMLVESGPIGGVIGASAYAHALGLDAVLAFDMGGTTAKCAVVQDGTYDVLPTYYVGGYVTGFPIRARVLDILEVGSGGGSIASVDPAGRLSVGPRSAGSSPGPVAFGRGGVEPTVTDANLALGRIAAGSFLDGDMKLDEAAAKRSLDCNIGEPLGYAPGERTDEIALGVLQMAALTMAAGIKRVLMDRGFDTRSIPLFVFGGGGPLHGVQLAEEVGIEHVIVPPLAGNFSAVGMLISDARVDDVRTFARPLDARALADAEPHFLEMQHSASNALGMGGTPRVQRFAGIRFEGQRHELNIPVRAGDGAPAIADRFLEMYSRRYGHAPETALEITVLRVSLTSETDHLTPEALGEWAFRLAGETAETTGTRRVVFDSGPVDAVPVVRRTSLATGWIRSGPLVVEEYGSTTLVPPGWSITVGRYGELRIDRTKGAVQ